MNKKILLLFSVLCVLQCNGYCFTKEEVLEHMLTVHAGHNIEWEYGRLEKPEPTVNLTTAEMDFVCANTSCTDVAVLTVNETFPATASWSISGGLELALKTELRDKLINKAQIGGKVPGVGITGESVNYTLDLNLTCNVQPKIKKHCLFTTVTRTASGTYRRSELYFHCSDCPMTIDVDSVYLSGTALGKDGYAQLFDEQLESCE